MCILRQDAEKSLVYFKNIRKFSKYEKQLISEELEKLKFGSNDDDGKVTLDDFSKRLNVHFCNLKRLKIHLQKLVTPRRQSFTASVSWL